jgi:hypothetical protein
VTIILAINNNRSPVPHDFNFPQFAFEIDG